jgi:hypothetical protein
LNLLIVSATRHKPDKHAFDVPQALHAYDTPIYYHLCALLNRKEEDKPQVVFLSPRHGVLDASDLVARDTQHTAANFRKAANVIQEQLEKLFQLGFGADGVYLDVTKSAKKALEGFDLPENTFIVERGGPEIRRRLFERWLQQHGITF